MTYGVLLTKNFYFVRIHHRRTSSAHHENLHVRRRRPRSRLSACSALLSPDIDRRFVVASALGVGGSHSPLRCAPWRRATAARASPPLALARLLPRRSCCGSRLQPYAHPRCSGHWPGARPPEPASVSRSSRYAGASPAASRNVPSP